jgi:mono/diheme cytochrome c family protein
MSRLFGIALAASFLGLAGCEPGPKSEKGFRLPDGDVGRGREAFLAHKCHTCHTVAGMSLPPPSGDVGPVALGGEVRRVRTYGELVTAIINPSHSLAQGHPAEKIAKDGTSKMPVFNDAMTVTQLADLVAFLQAQYKIVRDDALYYPYLP